MKNKFDILLWIASPSLLATGYVLMWQDFNPSMAAAMVWVGVLLPPFVLIGTPTLFRLIVTFLKQVKKGQHVLPMAGFIASVGMSLGIYFMTMAPSASLWDCSEFISAAAHLQIPHPPGAPLFLLTAHLFSWFALGDVTQAGWMVNAVSVIASGLTVGIAFLLVYALVMRYTTRWVAIAGGLTGALSLAFMDTFWFSAVEAEIYASASFFSFFILLVAFMLRRKQVHFRKNYLMLIAYLLGLGYCIHPMCLLVIPVISVCYLDWTEKHGFWGWLLSFCLGGLVLLLCNRALTEGLFKTSYALDIWLVNDFGLPFYSGVYALIIIGLSAGIFSIRNFPRSKSAVQSILFFVLGLSSYLLLFIRSGNEPAMDQHNPENLQTIASYMARESYGTRPLLYGPYYDAKVKGIQKGPKLYLKRDNRYLENGISSEYEYEEARQTIFPRMYSSDAKHVPIYEKWAGLRKGQKPRFRHNLIYFFRYQLGEMYWRYFLWNFAGRSGDQLHAEMMTPWQMTPASKLNAAKSFNQYWCLPLIVGFLGLVYLWKVNRTACWALISLFLMTGPILAVYLNSPPVEPRERDYIYVVSFMAFCLCIGLGVVYLGTLAKRYIKKPKQATLVCSGIGVFLVTLLLGQNFDDHDRSDQTIQLEYARSILNSCEKNAILLTGADNDTFPLWYLQDVENVRTDVRVIVLSYFNSDWCLEQLKSWHHDSPPLPLTLSKEQLRSHGANDVVFLDGKGSIRVKKLMQLINQGHKGLRRKGNFDSYYHQVPGHSFTIPGSDDIKGLSENIRAHLRPSIQIQAKDDVLYKSDLSLLDIIAHNAWKRPIYFNYTSLHGIKLHMQPHVVDEGLLYRLLPIDQSEELYNLEKSYENLMTKAGYKESITNNHYLNTEDHILRILEPTRMAYNELGLQLLNSGDKTRAAEVVQYARTRFYPDHLNSGMRGLQLAGLMLNLGMKAEAGDLLDHVISSAGALKGFSPDPYGKYHDYVIAGGRKMLLEMNGGMDEFDK